MPLYLHKKHGANPSMTQCFYCGKGKEILLVGASTGKFKEAGVAVSKDGKMPMYAGVFDMEPCDECKGYMEQGILLISVRDGTEDRGPDAYRTGGWVVVKDKPFKECFGWLPEELLASLVKQRWSYIPDTVWDGVGLPRREKK
jgi:hypothetical protein